MVTPRAYVHIFPHIAQCQLDIEKLINLRGQSKISPLLPHLTTNRNNSPTTGVHSRFGMNHFFEDCGNSNHASESRPLQ